MTGTDDDLSLEYILNVLDGIVELNNIIVFFNQCIRNNRSSLHE